LRLSETAPGEGEIRRRDAGKEIPAGPEGKIAFRETGAPGPGTGRLPPPP
jgi:hypothetical protein